jgi:hypothetical protein
MTASPHFCFQLIWRDFYESDCHRPRQSMNPGMTFSDCQTSFLQFVSGGNAFIFIRKTLQV